MPEHDREVRRAHAKRLATLAWVLLGVWGSPQAEAQFWGMGGLYAPDPSMSGTNIFLNQRSQAAGQAAYAARAASDARFFAGSAGSYASQVRDTTFFERYDPETRQRMTDRVARHPSRPRSAPTATPTQAPAVATVPTAPTRRVFPIASFFDRYGMLTWPADAPNEGELAAKRTTSDTASTQVLHETKRQGHATVGSVVTARERLLDYGRPALQLLRETMTPRVSDSFHEFLLSLYDSLERAVEPGTNVPR